jgi:hypothetical protein
VSIYIYIYTNMHAYTTHTLDMVPSQDICAPPPLPGDYENRACDVTHWWGDLNGKSYLYDLGVDGRIILKWIFKKWDAEA